MKEEIEVHPITPERQRAVDEIMQRDYTKDDHQPGDPVRVYGFWGSPPAIWARGTFVEYPGYKDPKGIVRATDMTAVVRVNGAEHRVMRSGVIPLTVLDLLAEIE